VRKTRSPSARRTQGFANDRAGVTPQGPSSSAAGQSLLKPARKCDVNTSLRGWHESFQPAKRRRSRINFFTPAASVAIPLSSATALCKLAGDATHEANHPTPAWGNPG